MTDMPPETLEALKGSIAKWEAIVAGTGTDKGTDNCSLCQMFLIGRTTKEYCTGCPVATETGSYGCMFTPYVQWECATEHQTSDSEEYERRVDSPETRKWAQAELDFLRSLLPKESA